MCGIFGFYLNRPLNKADIDMGKRGVQALKHRGPDSQGWWADAAAGLFMGHARLGIIDPHPRSDQPMSLRGISLTYNGEIYNFKEIREALGGKDFHTEGDAEVLMRAWDRWGKDSLDMFDGMYAFALYNGIELHLATDPFGEKTVYWCKTKDGFYFSSEPNPLIEALNMEREISSENMRDFVLFGFLPSPNTGYKGLYKTAPATHMTVTSGGRVINTYRHWIPPVSFHGKGAVKPLSEKELDSIQGALYESIRVRVRSDVPWGVFLSSGIDSTLALAMTVKDLNQSPLALTVSFPNADVADEFDAARRITQHLGVEHHCVSARHNDMYNSIKPTLDFYGDLNYNSVVIAANQMSVEARRYMKMALSGMGGDEIFYGYRRYGLLYNIARKADIMPAFLRNAAGSIGRGIFGHDSYMRKALCIVSSSGPKRAVYSRVVNAASWLDTVDGFRERLGSLVSQAGSLYDVDHLSAFELAQKLDILFVMPSAHIPAIERGSMRASLEVRTPYLNRSLLEAISKLDQRSLIAFGQKDALKRILARYLPKKLFDFSKKGFFTPRGVLLKDASMPLELNGLSQEEIRFIWDRKDRPDWREFAIRITAMDLFLSKEKRAEKSLLTV